MPVYIKFVGEGSADVGLMDASEEFPTLGVIPTLVYSLCGKPDGMRIRRGREPFLQKKVTRKKKVEVAKSQAFHDSQCDGVVYVVDTEGEDIEILMREMAASRDSKHANFPMAIGVAHPCLEAWILADPAAIKKGMILPQPVERIENPEGFVPSSGTPGQGLKRKLADLCNIVKKDLSVQQKTAIAREIQDLDRLGKRCPLSFAPFAMEVETQIKPLFFRQNI